MGKSRLVAEFVRAVRAGGGYVAFGECPAFGTHASYVVWQEVWRTPAARRRAARRRRSRRLALERELRGDRPGASCRGRRCSARCSGSRSPTPISPRSFDAKLRKASLEELLAECLRARAAEELLVLVLEDCHWIGPLSRDLLEVLVAGGGGAAGARSCSPTGRPPSRAVGWGSSDCRQFTRDRARRARSRPTRSC